jgi:hypothetical protein
MVQKRDQRLSAAKPTPAHDESRMKAEPAGTRSLIAVIAALSLVAGACGDDGSVEEGEASSEAASSTVTSTTQTEPGSTEFTTTTLEPAPTSTTGEPPTTTVSVPPTTPLPDDQLPGTVFELAPPPGRILAVVGVRHDDFLNVRLAPGTDNPVVAELEPLADDFVATGRARMLTRSIWWEITTADGVVGWVGSSFTAQSGPTSDVTSQVVEELGGLPEEETMAALGLVVAESLTPDPDIPSEVVLVVLPSVGDLGEVTYDVVGLGDDAVRALRLHVFGQPLDQGEGFALMSVEATDMCESVRGVSEPGGLCA